jgi:hypothetical protein
MINNAWWWTWVPLSLFFSAPWIAGTVWMLIRSDDGGAALQPSVAELAQQRLWTR